MRQLQLPADYLHTITTEIAPLCEQVHDLYRAQQCPLVLGINGPQGSGKSTFASFVQQRLHVLFGLSVVVISLDDLYLSRAQRQQLARQHHPLLQTRGVPGTHDVDLGIQLLQQLKQANPGQQTAIPRFDKARDDRCPRADWDQHMGRADIIVLEGWCLGAPAQNDSALQQPINRLEAKEDPDGRWRRYVNQRLREDYPRLFKQIDWLVYLSITDFEQVHQWRALQERKLTTDQPQPGLMDSAGLCRFIAHFERLTRHMMHEMPSRADRVIAIAREAAPG